MPDLSTRLLRVRWNALSGCLPAVTRALEEVLVGRPAERVIDRALRANRAWSPEQRAAAVEAIFSVALWRRRLAHQLGSSAAAACAPRLLLFALLRDLGGVFEAEAATLAALETGSPVPPRRDSPRALADFDASTSSPGASLTPASAGLRRHSS